MIVLQVEIMKNYSGTSLSKFTLGKIDYTDKFTVFHSTLALLRSQLLSNFRESFLGYLLPMFRKNFQRNKVVNKCKCIKEKSLSHTSAVHN